QVLAAGDHGDPDLGGGDHLDVDTRLVQRGEQPGGHAWVRPHPGADQGDLAHAVVVLDLGVAVLGGHRLQRGAGSGALLVRQGEGDVGDAGVVHRHVLHDHVDVHPGCGHGLEELRGAAGDVRDADDGDLGLGAVVGHTGDERVFHRSFFVVVDHDRALVVGERAAHVDGHLVAAGVLDGAQVQDLRPVRGQLQGLLGGDAVDAPCAGHDPRVGGEQTIDVGVDLADCGTEPGRERHGGGVRAAAAQRGDVVGELGDALEAGDDRHRTVVQGALDAAGGDVDDP